MVVECVCEVQRKAIITTDVWLLLLSIGLYPQVAELQLAGHAAILLAVGYGLVALLGEHFVNRSKRKSSHLLVQEYESEW